MSQHKHRHSVRGPNYHRYPDLKKYEDYFARARSAEAAIRSGKPCRPGKIDKNSKSQSTRAQDEHLQKLAEDEALAAKMSAIAEKRFALQEALKFSPHDSRANGLLALSLTTEGRKNKTDALSFAKASIKNDPTSGLGHFALAHTLSSTADHLSKALHACDSAMLYKAKERGQILEMRKSILNEIRIKRRDFIEKKLVDKTPNRIVSRLESSLNRSRVRLLLADVDKLLNRDAQISKEGKSVKSTRGLRENYQTTEGNSHVPLAWNMSKDVKINSSASVGRPFLLAKYDGIIGYYEDGQYTLDCKRVMTSTKRYLQRMLLRWDLKKRETAEANATATEAISAMLDNGTPPVTLLKKKKRQKRSYRRRSSAASRKPPINVIAVDIDDTVISSYPFMKKHGFCADSPAAPLFDARYLGMNPEAVTPIKPVLDFVNWVEETPGINLVFFTERPVWCKPLLMKTLKAAGLDESFIDIRFCKQSKHSHHHHQNSNKHVEALHQISESPTLKHGNQTEHIPEPVERNFSKDDNRDDGHRTLKRNTHFAMRTIHSAKISAMELFEKDISDGIRRRIVAIVGDQDSDFPDKERTFEPAMTNWDNAEDGTLGVSAKTKKIHRAEAEDRATIDESDTFELPLCIKLPNYMYTLQ